MTDGKGKARAAILAGGGSVRLGEGIEEPGDLLRSDTDTVVAHRHPDEFTPAALDARSHQVNFSVVREFAGV